MSKRRNFYRAGTVDGKVVNDILLDTGCTHTLIRIWCLRTVYLTVQLKFSAHGDCVEYPLAGVDIAVNDKHVKILARSYLQQCCLVKMCPDSGICWDETSPRWHWWLRPELQPNVKRGRLQNEQTEQTERNPLTYDYPTA